MLHFAPEPCFRAIFRRQFGQYETVDLSMEDVDCNLDIRNLPFRDASYDFILASIVLDYIADDSVAMREIRRVLKVNGVAILPVSLAGATTIEYSEPNPFEAGHVRSCGLDYFERYERYFREVQTLSSDSFPGKYQLFIYEDRTVWPNKACPMRRSMPGEKHIDVVPVCHA